jgi:hypothetical protein
MRPFWIKLALFLCLWYEVAAELRLDGDRAFLVSVMIVGAGWLVLRLSGPLIGMLGPNTHRLLVGTLLWLALFWWFGPGFLKALPIVFVLAGAFGIAYAGGRARHWLNENRDRLNKAFLREHSGAVLAVTFGALALAFIVENVSGSIWILIGYGLLLGLPLGFGWQLAETVGARRFDAKVGKEEAFRDAGLSEER